MPPMFSKIICVKHFELHYCENLSSVKVPQLSANQTTSQLKLCPGNSTRHTKIQTIQFPLILLYKLKLTKLSMRKRAVLLKETPTKSINVPLIQLLCYQNNCCTVTCTYWTAGDATNAATLTTSTAPMCFSSMFVPPPPSAM